MRIWSLETGDVLLTIPGGGSDITYSPDGSYLATVGPESSLIVHIRDVSELAHQAKRRLTRWWTEDECPPTWDRRPAHSRRSISVSLGDHPEVG